jgi:hypothetical protein
LHAGLQKAIWASRTFYSDGHGSTKRSNASRLSLLTTAEYDDAVSHVPIYVMPGASPYQQIEVKYSGLLTSMDKYFFNVSGKPVLFSTEFKRPFYWPGKRKCIRIREGEMQCLSQ